MSVEGDIEVILTCYDVESSLNDTAYLNKRSIPLKEEFSTYYVLILFWSSTIRDWRQYFT